MSQQKLDEKWAKEVAVKHTGENAGKSIAQLKKEIAALRGQPGNKEKMGKLLFALRAKEGWKKHTGVAQEWYEFTEEDLSLIEKWGGNIKIHHTGENTNKSIAQLKKEIAALRGKPGNKEEMGKLLFALRAKEGWKKHTGVAKEQFDWSDDDLTLLEKWEKHVEVQRTGENAGKSIAQLKKEIAALRGKEGNKEKMGKLLFALRAKQGWKKHTGISQEMMTEPELDFFLNYVYESQNHPEKDLFARFIGEATLEQKIALLMIETETLYFAEANNALIESALQSDQFNESIESDFVPFWIAHLGIKASNNKSFAKCSEGKIFDRQRCRAKCVKTMTERIVEAASKVKCESSICEQKRNALISKYKNKASHASQKYEAYK